MRLPLRSWLTFLAKLFPQARLRRRLAQFHARNFRRRWLHRAATERGKALFGSFVGAPFARPERAGERKRRFLRKPRLERLDPRAMLDGGGLSNLTLTLTPAPLETGDDAQLAANFSDADGASTFTVSIDWGDGSSDAPAASGTAFDDNHVYSAPGTYTIDATVSDEYSSSTSDTITVVVTDPTLAIDGFALSSSSAESGSDVAAFGDIGGLVAGRNYTETIDWGDGSIDNIAADNSGTVEDNHVYADPGTYTVTANVADDHGRVATTSATETVSDPALAIDGFALSPATTTLGQAVSVSGNLDGIVAGRSYTETVEWGDGTSDTLVSGGANTLADSHTYADVGTYTVTASVADDHGHQATAAAAETVASATSGSLPEADIAATQNTAYELAGTAGQFTVTLSAAPANPLVVLYTVGGTAGSGSDYQALPGYVTIPAGQTSATIAVTPINDKSVDVNQTVVVTLASAADYVVGTNSSDMVTIVDDNPEVVSVKATTPTADAQTGAQGVFTVSRAGPVSSALTVSYSVGGSGIAGTNFSAIAGSVTIPTGQSSSTVDVAPLTDPNVETQDIAVASTVTGGTYDLTMGAETTAPVAYNADAAAVQSALTDLTNIGLGNVTVTGSGTAGDPFVVTFGGGLTDVSVPQIMADSSSLVGGGVTTSMVTQGAGDSTVTLDLTTSSDYSLGSSTIDTVFITDNTSTAPTAEASQYSAVTGQTLSVAAAGVLSGASDPGRSALSAVLLAAPTNGTLTLNADGSFGYTPAAGFEGTDTFWFQAFDGSQYSLPQQATVNVTAQPAPAVEVTAPGVGEVNAQSSWDMGTTGTGFPLVGTLTINNTGTTALSLDPNSLSLPAGFSLVTPFAGDVAAGQSTTLVIQLDAQAAGTASGTLSFNTSDPSTPTFECSISGTVDDSPHVVMLDGGGNTIANGTGSVSLGTAEQGTALTTTVTIENAGNTDLTLDPSQLTLPAGFSVVTPYATDVAPGGSTTLALEIDGSTVGTFSGNVSFPTNDVLNPTFSFNVSGEIDPDAPVMEVFNGGTQIASGGTVDFGTTDVGSPVQEQLTIKNVGTADLLLPPAVSAPLGFRFVSLDSTDVAPGGTATLTLELIAGSEEADSGQALIYTNDTAAAPFTLTVMGNVVAPHVAVTMGGTAISDINGYVNFGNTPLGAPVIDTFTVTNQGQGTMILSDPIDVPVGFSVVSDYGNTTLAAGQSTTFQVQLNADNPGGYEGAVVLETNDSQHALYRFQVGGEVGAPLLAVSEGAAQIPNGSGSVDFGNTPVGAPVVETFDVTNNGASAIDLKDPIGLPAGFSLVSDFGNPQLNPGQSTSFAIELTAAAAGFYSGDVSFGTSGLAAGAFQFAVSGGVAVPKLRVQEGTTDVTGATSAVGFGTTAVGQPVVEQFTVTNLGSANAVLSDPISVPAGFALESDFGANSLAPGASTTFSVELSAAAAGLYGGDITFGTNLPSGAAGVLSTSPPGTVGAIYSMPVEGAVTAISSFRLLNDTGVSATDGVTSDPTVTGRVEGSGFGVQGSGTLEVQFSVNGSGSPYATATADNQGNFLFTPPGLVPGSVTVEARVYVVNAALGGDVYGDWTPLSFTLVADANAQPVVDDLALQTVTVPTATTPTSSIATITGVVRNDGNVANMRVQVDTSASGSGQVAATVYTDANGNFTYAPGNLAPGTYTYHFRAIDGAYANGEAEQLPGDWFAFTFTVVAPNAPVVDTLALADVTGPGTSTTDPTLSGHITADGAPKTVEVDFEYNNDTVVDASINANADGTFSFTPVGLQPGSNTVHVRAVNVDANVTGAWTAIAFTLVAPQAPSVTNFHLANELSSAGGSGGTPTASDSTVEGTLVAATTSGPGSTVANVTVQFSSADDGVPDGSAITDTSGNFSYQPTNLKPGTITIEARAITSDATGGITLVGAWVSLTFTLVDPPGPTVTSLALASPTGTDAATGLPTATDATLNGTLTNGANPASFLTVQYIVNPVTTGSNGGTTQPDGSTITDANGKFTFLPQGLSPGTNTVEVRGVSQDPVTGDELDGAWTTISFVLVQQPFNVDPPPPAMTGDATDSDQVAASSEQAAVQTIDQALATLNSGTGLGSAASGQIALGIGTYSALAGMSGGTVSTSGNAISAYLSKASGSSSSGSGGPGLPGSPPALDANAPPLDVSNLTTPTAESGSINGQAITSSGTVGPAGLTINGTLSASWSVTDTPDPSTSGVTDWSISVTMSVPYNSSLSGSYTDSASATHNYNDNVDGSYTFGFSASGTSTDTGGGTSLSGTYTLNESSSYSVDYSDTPSGAGYTVSSTGSHTFNHTETNGSMHSPSGGGYAGPNVTSDYTDSENEYYQTTDNGSAPDGNNAASNTFDFSRTAGATNGRYASPLSSAGGWSDNADVNDDVSESYYATTTESSSFSTSTSGGSTTGGTTISATTTFSLNDSESGTSDSTPTSDDLNISNFNDQESDDETDHIKESGNESQTIGSVTAGGSFNFDETDDDGGFSDENGSYDDNNGAITASGDPFSDGSHASSSLSYHDGGSYSGTASGSSLGGSAGGSAGGSGGSYTVSGSFTDDENDNLDDTENDGGTFDIGAAGEDDKGTATLDETASGSFTSTGSDSANSANTTYGDSYLDTGNEDDTFDEGDSFNDQPTTTSDSGSFTQNDTANETATASDNFSTSDSSSSLAASDSYSSSTSDSYNDTGNFDDPTQSAGGTGSAADTLGGKEGQTDTENDLEKWGENGSFSGSDSYQFNEGGGQNVSDSYGENDNWSIDGTNPESDSGGFGNNDTATASASYSESGVTTSPSASVNYSDGDTATESNNYNDGGSFSGSGTGDSRTDNFTEGDTNTDDSSATETGTYTDPGGNGWFAQDSTNDTLDKTGDSGSQNTGTSDSGTSTPTYTDSAHSTYNEHDGGVTGGGSAGGGASGGSYTDFESDDDTSTDGGSETLVAGATVGPSGSFSDTTNDIQSEGGSFSDPPVKNAAKMPKDPFALPTSGGGSGSGSGGGGASGGGSGGSMSASAASGPTEHDSTYQYASDSYSEGGSFSAGGQSVTANFHAHDHNVNTDDGSESRPVAGGGGSNSDSGDSSDVTDDANDGNYSSVSGTLTQSGTATDDEKQTDKGQQGQSTSFAGASSSGSQQVSGGGSDDDHAHETGSYTDVNGKLTAEDMNYTDDDITKQFNSRTDSASGLYLTSGNMTSGDSMGNSASQSYHDSGETIVSAGGADTSDKGGSHTTASASASNSFSGTVNTGTGTSGTQTLKENELDTKDDGAANYDIENGADVSEHDTFNDAKHGDSSSVNTVKQTFGGVSSSQSYSSGGHSDVTDNGSDDQANGATTDETDNFTDDSHLEDTSNYVTSAGGGAVANAANGVWGDWNNMPSLVQASYLWGSQVGLGDSALTYPGLAPNAVSSTANSNTDATFKHHDDGEYSLTSGTSGTSENFNDTNTYNDNASQWISAVGNYSYAGDETDTTQITQNSAVDNETDIDGGLIDAGVTTEHYKNTGGETDIASSSGTTIGTYTSGGGSASGTSFEEEISSFTETGSYATLPTTSSTSGTTSSTTGGGGTSTSGTGGGSGGGYASSSQHIVYDDNVTETLTDNGNGLESGPGVSVTGVGTYFGTASSSVHSDSTHTTDASAGIDTTTGNYSVSFSDNNNYSYNENGEVVVPQTQSETWSHAGSYAAQDKNTASGDYADPTGNETLSSCGAGSTSETVTWEDWSSDGSGGGHWETPPNTSFNGSTSPSSGSPSVVTTSEPGTPAAPSADAPPSTGRAPSDVLANLQQQPAHGGKEIPLKVGQGPISVVGIVGNGQLRGDRTTGTFQVANGVALAIAAKNPVRYGGLQPQMYESNTASDLNGSGQNVADITQKQLAAIKAASNAGQLNNAKFSVVIVGYSWGGDKAISAAMELYEALKAEGLEDKVDIHLVTMDAVERGKATPTPIKTPSYPKSIFASWHNYYETADAFTPGQAYPGAAADKEVTALHPVLPNILAAGRTVETDLGL